MANAMAKTMATMMRCLPAARQGTMVAMAMIMPAYSAQRQDGDDSDDDTTCLQHAEARYSGDDNDATCLGTTMTPVLLT